MSTAVEVPRRSRVEQVMGLPVSVLLRGQRAEADEAARAVDALYAELRRVDAAFSPWKPDSEVSRLRDGRLTRTEASPELSGVLDLCERARLETGGWFDVDLPDASGLRRPDPSGLVKGWAVEQAARPLRDLEDVDWLVNAGGDVLGLARPGAPWRVGVEDPRDRSRMLAVVPLTDGAVATSGTAARGAHLIDPRTGTPVPDHLLSVTVVGPSLCTADVHATAAFVEGPGSLHRLEQLPGYEALLVLPDGSTRGTSGAARRVQLRPLPTASVPSP